MESLSYILPFFSALNETKHLAIFYISFQATKTIEKIFIFIFLGGVFFHKITFQIKEKIEKHILNFRLASSRQITVFTQLYKDISRVWESYSWSKKKNEK